MYSNKRKYAYSKSTKGKRGAAIALRRAAATLRRSYGPPLGPVATRGFYGLWQSRGRNELKTVDVSGTNTTPISTTTGTVSLINGVATGTDYTNRVGRKIILKSLLLRIMFNPVVTGTVDATLGDNVRLICVLDMQPNGVVISGSDLLLNTGSPTDPLNLNNRDRFKIIWDKMISFPSYKTTTGSLTTGSPTAKCMKLYKKMSQEVIFNGTGSTIGSIQTGALYLFQLCQGGFTQSTFSTRVRFIDG